MKSILIPIVDKIIIRIGLKIQNEHCDNNIFNDFKLLLNTLKREAVSTGSNEIISNLETVSQAINQNATLQPKPILSISREIFIDLIDQYIKIIDAK